MLFHHPVSMILLPWIRSSRLAHTFVGCDKSMQKHAFGAIRPKAVSLIPPLRFNIIESHNP